MQSPLRPKTIRLERSLPARYLNMLPRRVHEEVAVSRADGAVAFDEFLGGERGGEGDCVADCAAVAEGGVGLGV